MCIYTYSSRYRDAVRGGEKKWNDSKYHMPRKSVRVPWVRQTYGRPIRLVGNSGEWSEIPTKNIIKADSHIACRAHAVPLPCRAVKSHMPCRAPALLRQCRVLRESPYGSRKYPNCWSNSLTDGIFCSVLLPLFTVVGMDRCEEDWYASDNNVRGTPRGGRKKPNAGR